MQHVHKPAKKISLERMDVCRFIVFRACALLSQKYTQKVTQPNRIDSTRIGSRRANTRVTEL